jgi:hypothetical protein
LQQFLRQQQVVPATMPPKMPLLRPEPQQVPVVLAEPELSEQQQEQPFEVVPVRKLGRVTPFVMQPISSLRSQHIRMPPFGLVREFAFSHSILCA